MRVNRSQVIDTLLSAFIPLALLFEMILLSWMALETTEIRAVPGAWSGMVGCGILAMLFVGWQLLSSPGRHLTTRVLIPLSLATLVVVFLTIRIWF